MMRMSEEGVFQADISREELNELPLRVWQGKIDIIDVPNEIPRAIEEILYHPFSGFDTESKPAFKKGQNHPIALIQVAIPDKVFLFRICKTGYQKQLLQYLNHKNHQKIGIGLRDDLSGLKNEAKIEPQGFEELNQLVKPLGIESNGLRKLAGILMNCRISKNAQVTNWEAEALNKKQVLYAATDAWVCHEMYWRLQQNGYL